jgi:hypothetical protein
MFQRKGMTSLVFPKEKIIGWLSWLARKMREHSQSVFLVEGYPREGEWGRTRGATPSQRPKKNYFSMESAERNPKPKYLP